MLYIDIETYSATDLKRAGVYRYVEDPDFQILMAGWSLDGENYRLAVGEDAIRKIPGLWDDNVYKVAHNAPFERICFSRMAGLPTGTYLDPEPWIDTAALAAEYGYPRKLEELAKFIGADPKDTAGTRLINIFCKPNRKGTRTLPEDKLDDWLQFMEYCLQDVRTLYDVHQRLPEWRKDELAVFLADQRINDRGFAIDVELAERGKEAAEENHMVQELEISQLTGLRNPNSRDQLLGWLKSDGVKITNLRAETVQQVLDEQPLTKRQRRVLKLRQSIALSASKKYTSALESVCSDGRVRGGFTFFGAHTGRWSGRGVQPHNLPRASLASQAHVEAAIMDLALGAGASAKTLRALVRAMLVGPFTVVDYSAIEARVVSWLAGEQWALDAFKAGRDIYVETAERMGGLTRFQGKVAVLALGYNGSVGSLRAMGAEGNDDQLLFLVNQWRRANRKIVRYWSSLEEAFRYGDGRNVGEHISVVRDGTDRLLVLPSGRALTYHRCKFGKRMSFADPRGFRVETYGGRLTENITQAVARDVLAEALVRLDGAGYQVVGHVHDEVIVEGEHTVEDVRKLMIEQPHWADGLPLDGEGFTTYRYKKG